MQSILYGFPKGYIKNYLQHVEDYGQGLIWDINSYLDNFISANIITITGKKNLYPFCWGISLDFHMVRGVRI